MKKVAILCLFLSACSHGSEVSVSQITDTAKSQAQLAVESGLLQAVNFADEPLHQFHVLERMKEFNVPGFSFALISDGEIEWTGYYGVKDANTGTPVDHETLFQAASIAKPVTAFAIGRMHDAGLFELDAPVEQYLTDFVLPGQQMWTSSVTLRNILAHTSGISGGGYPGYEQGVELPTELQILTGMSPANTQAIRLENEPNTTIAYSGGGYTLIEHMLQARLESDFADIMQEWVFEPLDLSASSFLQPLPQTAHEKVAKAHELDGAVVDGGWNNYPERAAAGLWTTADDLARFAIEVRNAYLGDSELLSQATAHEMLSSQIDDAAVGFLVRGEGDSFTFRHAGSNRGYFGYFVMHLNSGDGAVYLSNSNNGSTLGAEMLRAASRHYGWAEMQTELYTRIELDSESLEILAGTYEMNTGWQVRVTYLAGNNQIALVFPNDDIYPLVPIGAGRFIYQRDGTQARFEIQEGIQSIELYGQTGVKR